MRWSRRSRAEFAGEDGDVAAAVELVEVVGEFEAEAAEADGFVIDAVAIEVDDVIGLARGAGAGEFVEIGRASCRERV